MKTQTADIDPDKLEEELAGLAKLVRQGFRLAGEPSPEVEEAIRQEAFRCAGKCRARIFSPFYLKFAAAAGLMLLLGGAFQLHLTRQTEGRVEPAGLRLAKDAPKPASGKTEDNSGFARMLLDIQGMDEEGYFTGEAAEALWL